jgi:hypothetical protein
MPNPLPRAQAAALAPDAAEDAAMLAQCAQEAGVEVLLSLILPGHYAFRARFIAAAQTQTFTENHTLMLFETMNPTPRAVRDGEALDAAAVVRCRLCVCPRAMRARSQ